MKWEDTVIPVEERIKMGVWHGRERQAQAQAEISFKAGVKEVGEWVDENIAFANIGLSYKDWQAQKKKWGIGWR